MASLDIDKFSEICRLCLKPKKDSEIYLSVMSFKNEDGLNLSEQMNAMFFPIPDDISPFLPDYLCKTCYNTFQSFCKYRERMNLLLQFLIGYVEMKYGNRNNIRDLYAENRHEITKILHDLKICPEDIKDIEQHIGDPLEKKQEKTSFNFNYVDVTANVEFEIEDVKQHRTEKTKKLPKKPSPKKKANVSFSDDDYGFDYSVIDTSDCLDECSKPKKQKQSKAKTNKELKRQNTVSHMLKEEKDTKIDNADVEKNPQSIVASTSQKPVKTKSNGESKPRKPYKMSLKCKYQDCGEVFLTTTDLQLHKQDAHSKYICDFCGIALKKKYNLELHINRHTGTTKFPCKFCNSSYYTEGELKIHTDAIHMITEVYQCKICGIALKNKRSLNSHYSFHSDERKFACDKCPLTFKTGGHLRRHFNDVHRAIKYNCEHCDINYGRKDKLRMHMERAHGIQTYFNCDICLKSFQSNEKLEEHKEMHRNPKEFECGICLLAHKTKEEFDNHLCITYREDYICCNHDFRYHSYYNKHMFIAHGVKINARVKPSSNILTGCERAQKKYKPRCTKCGKEFSSRKLKNEHTVNCKSEKAS